MDNTKTKRVLSVLLAFAICVLTLALSPVSSGYSASNPHLAEEASISAEMDAADIHDGHLVLINADIGYDIPADLDLVNVESYKTVPYKVISDTARLHRSIMEPFDAMMQAFIDETERNIIALLSGFRDRASQQATLDHYINLEGLEAALLRAKRPGHSEHHTGLAFDLATFVDGRRQPFTFYDITTSWFSQNAYKYGFILRYPSDKTDVTDTMYEPWHYRYVGMPHSYIIYDSNWVLEEYIENIREYSAGEPLEVAYDGEEYEVFFTDSTIFSVPKYAFFAVSGNNIDGFIVTIFGRYDRMTVSRGGGYVP